MNVFQTAFWALKALKKSAASDKPAEESQTEFLSRTVDLSPAIPHWNKGLILERRGDRANAILAYRDAVRAVPNYFDAHENLTRLLCETEQWDEAIKHGEMAVRLRRNSPKVHNNLSVAFYNKGQVAKAIQHCSAALQLSPTDNDLVENLVQIRQSHPELENSPQMTEAKENVRVAAEALYEHGFNLLEERKIREAIATWRTTLRLAPDWPEPMCNLAAILATYPEDAVRSPKEAVDLATKALKLGDRAPHYYDALAAAYANTGRFPDACRTLQEILPTLRTNGPLEAAVNLAEHLQLYTERKPLRQELPLFRPMKVAAQTGFYNNWERQKVHQ